MHGNSEVQREDAIRNDYENARTAMLKCAYINIKKFDGKTQSNVNELKGVANRDKEMLEEQLSLIRPNIIIFCSTFSEILKDVLFGTATKITGTTRCYEKDGTLLVDFFHPTRIEVNSFNWLKDEINLIANKERFLK